MATNPPPFSVEDGTDEDFFDKLVNDDEDVDFKVTSSSASGGLVLTDGEESDEAKAFANLSINELDENGEVDFDDKSNLMGVDDVCSKVETAEHINKVDNVEVRSNPLVSSISFEFDSLIQNPGNENGVADVFPDATAVSNTADMGSSDDVIKSSGGSGAPGVKEVDWSAFHADSAQNDGNGFGSYSDFFNEFEGGNAGDAFGKMVEDTSITGPQGDADISLSYADSSNNHAQYNEGYNAGIAADQSSFIQDPNSSQYWESQYPGWKYDPSTQQWYQVDSYVGGECVQSNVDSTNISSTLGGMADGGQATLSYMQQTAQSVAGAIADSSTTNSVTTWNQDSQVSDPTVTTTNWNQVSQVSGDSNVIPSDWNQEPSYENNGYPPHMVFDPQYPGWYYDNIAQSWLTLESYNASAQSTTQGEEQMNKDENALSDSFSRNNSPKAYNANVQDNSYISQGLDKSWLGSVKNDNQQSSTMWLPETAPTSEATSMYNVNQTMGNQYGHNVSLNNHGNQNNFVHYGVKDPYSENLSHGRNDFSVPSRFDGGGNLRQPFNDAIVNRNDQNQSTTDFYHNQNLVNFPHNPSPNQHQHQHQHQPQHQHQHQPQHQPQHQHQNATISYTPTSGRSSAGRPAHALVGFGFGGKLIVMRHSSTENLNFGSQNPVGGSISILNLAEVVHSNFDSPNHGMGVSNYFQALCRQFVPGPLAGGSVGTKELNKWIDERITNLKSADMDNRRAEVLSLLLSLLKIGCQYYGKLRSPYGTDAVSKESDSPESAVAKLFASVRSGSQFNQYGVVAQCLQQLPSEGQMRVTAVEVQNLLVSGRKKEALQCAQEGQLWGPALVLAPLLGDQFYVETIKQMALRHLVAGSPLRTLCLLIAGQPADVFSTDSMSSAVNVSHQPAQLGDNGMLDDWEENLAVITANRTKDDGLVLVHLGDCLWKQRSDINAAHICYLVAEATFDVYSDSARLCLIGADHWRFPRTYASPEAIQMTEIYEYSKTLGNSQFVLLSFQPYKFVYALMLAEVGRLSEALKYCQAVLKLLKTSRTPEVDVLRHLVSSLEERIKTHQQGGFSVAPKEFIGKLLNLFDKTHSVVTRVGLPPPIPTTGSSTVHSNENPSQSVGHRVPTSQSTMAMSSLAPSQSMEPISEWAADSNRMSMHTRSVSEPDFGKSPKGQADTLKEASSTGARDKASAAGGGTSRFGRFGFGSQLLQKTVGLVLKPRQGRQAKLGDTNKFYYDETLKRWVEEGAERPAQEAALPPPPPRTTAFQNGTSEYNLNSSLQSEASHNNLSHGLNTFKTSSAADNITGMPPLPPTNNQYSARGRMGVRSRYVDTFNQGGGGNATSSFQSPPVPSAKPASGANPKFFVPTPLSSNAEQHPVATPEQNTSSTNTSPEDLSPSAPNDTSFQSPAPPPSINMQRYASMNNISNKETSHKGSFSAHSRRTASWSGICNDSFRPSPLSQERVEGKPLGEVLGMQPSSFMPSNPSLVHSSMNGGSFGEDLHEVEL